MLFALRTAHDAQRTSHIALRLTILRLHPGCCGAADREQGCPAAVRRHDGPACPSDSAGEDRCYPGEHPAGGSRLAADCSPAEDCSHLDYLYSAWMPPGRKGASRVPRLARGGTEPGRSDQCPTTDSECGAAVTMRAAARTEERALTHRRAHHFRPAMEPALDLRQRRLGTHFCSLRPRKAAHAW